jgi:hypothetical protein
VINLRKASKLIQIISGISVLASTAGAVDYVCNVTAQNSGYAQKAIGTLSNNCSDSGTVREVLCFTGSSYATGTSMSLGQVRNCSSVLQWRTYAFNSAESAKPAGSYIQAQTIGLNSSGTVINSPISVDNAADGIWSGWTSVASGSVSIKTVVIYYYT